mmetsp:Transcript_5997/g.10187  ORF Transcript_5997/g.10187 Transcript_5997/m.10187 type:complete len:304 (+) Transcript_5997:453-1364(+)
MCSDKKIVASTLSLYFVGYFSGSLLFPFPDVMGRSSVIKYSFFFVILGQVLVIYVNNLTIKGLGFFIHGFFHIRASMCYVMLFELVEDQYKSLTCTILNVVDGFTMGVTCIWFMFVSQDALKFLEYSFWVGTIASVLIIFLTPESPVFLILNDKQSDAKVILNQIAKVNKSANQVQRQDHLTLKDPCLAGEHHEDSHYKNLSLSIDPHNTSHHNTSHHNVSHHNQSYGKGFEHSLSYSFENSRYRSMSLLQKTKRKQSVLKLAIEMVRDLWNNKQEVQLLQKLILIWVAVIQLWTITALAATS